jgi:hypothetical protein
MFRVILVDDRKRSCRSVRTEHQRARRIEHCAVRALTDRHAGDAMAIGAVRHNHLLVLADRKQAMVRVVERQSGRLLTGFQRPGGDDFQRLFIYDGKLGLVLDIHVHPAMPVADGEFGFATERNRSDRLERLCVDHAGILAAPIERVQTMLVRVVQDDVGILPVDLRLSDRPERLQVEYRH